MEISNLVVARYLDGRTLKGVTRDFSPNRAMFHVDPQDGSAPVELRFRQLKALFFVNSLEGDPARQDVRGFVHGPLETQQGKKVAVRFRDGEFICGYTLSWSPDREGFFMFPADVLCSVDELDFSALSRQPAAPSASSMPRARNSFDIHDSFRVG